MSARSVWLSIAILFIGGGSANAAGGDHSDSFHQFWDAREVPLTGEAMTVPCDYTSCPNWPDGSPCYGGSCGSGICSRCSATMPAQSSAPGSYEGASVGGGSCDSGACDQAACGTDCCESCCNNGCCYFIAEALWLQRNRPNRFPLSFPGSDENPILTTDSLHNDLEPGTRLTLGIPCCNCNALEITYFGFQSWDDSASVVDPNRLLDSFIRVGVQNVANFRNAFQQTISEESEIHNLEINARHWLPGDGCWNGSLLAGFRYIHFNDRLNFLSNDTDPALFPQDIGLYSVRTTNDLVGGQIGGTLAYRLSSRLNVGGKLKGGLLANFNEQRSRLLNAQQPGVVTRDSRVTASETTLAGLIETGPFANYWVTPRFAIVGGYDVISISGMAFAPDQLDFTARTFAPGQGFINNNGTLVVHGPYIGGWINW